MSDRIDFLLPRHLEIAEKAFRRFPDPGRTPAESAAAAFAEELNTENGRAVVEVLTKDQHPTRAAGYTFDDLRGMRFPPREALLCHGQEGIFFRGGLVELYASRGTGKSLFAGGIALALATGGEFLKWHAPLAIQVLLIDGEMPGLMVKDRLEAEARRRGLTSCRSLVVIARDWQPDGFMPRLDTTPGQALIEADVAAADVVIFDNRSCLFDPEGEKDGAAWQPAQDYLLSLRRLGKLVIVLHHTSRLGTARGHSRPEDVMDVLVKLSRPEGYLQEQGARFRVEFDKTRGFFGPAAEPFVAALREEGWQVEGDVRSPGRGLRELILDYLRTEPGGASKGQVVGNVEAREQAVRRALDDMAEAGEVRKREGRFYAR